MQEYCISKVKHVGHEPTLKPYERLRLNAALLKIAKLATDGGKLSGVVIFSRKLPSTTTISSRKRQVEPNHPRDIG
jgi:hypothetical protein